MNSPKKGLLEENYVSCDSELLESSIKENAVGFDWIKTPRTVKKSKKLSRDPSQTSSTDHRPNGKTSEQPLAGLMVKKLSGMTTGGKCVPSSRKRALIEGVSPVQIIRPLLLRASKTPPSESRIYPRRASAQRKLQGLDKEGISDEGVNKLIGSKRVNVEAWLASSATCNPALCTPPMSLSPPESRDNSLIGNNTKEVLMAICGSDWDAGRISKTDIKRTMTKPVEVKPRNAMTVNKPINTVANRSLSQKVKRKIFNDRTPAKCDNKLTVYDVPDDTPEPKPARKKPTKRKRKVSISSNETSPVVGSGGSATPIPTECNSVPPKTPRRTFLASLSVSSPSSVGHPEAQVYKVQYAKKKDELVSRLFKLYNSEVFNGQLPDNLAITWNPKMRGTAGFCFNKKKKTGGMIVRSSRIELAPKVLDRADRLRDTLIHELCHAAAWIIDNEVNGHGVVWKAWTKKAMTRFPELPAVRRCHNYQIATKFTYRCVGCGYSVNRQSRSIDMDRKRCGHCFGKLELLYNRKKKGASEVPEFDTTRTLRPPNIFARFVKDNYKRLKDANPGKTNREIMKLVSEEYALFKTITTPASK